MNFRRKDPETRDCTAASVYVEALESKGVEKRKERNLRDSRDEEREK
jgi:hypothetical protein